MKTILLLLLAVPVMASCPNGSTEYQGLCASDQMPEISPSVKPSDEKAPQSGMPSYQAAGVKATEPQSLIYQDAKQDQDRKDAESAGKIAAGVQ